MAESDIVKTLPPVRGIMLMIAAVASLTVLDSTAKFLSQDLPIFQIVWARYLFSLLIFPLLFSKASIHRALKTKHPWVQIGRALLLVGATASIFFAVHYLPLAETYAISFVSPFLAALFAKFLLGERVSRKRWIAIAVGFSGVIIVIQPGSGVFSWAIIFPLAMAVFWSLYQVVTRLLSATEPPLTTLFFTIVTGSIALTFVAPFFWVVPSPVAWLLMAFMGLIGLVGQWFVIKAYAIATPSLLAPFAYTQIVWATLIGYVIFGDYPSAPTLIGVVVVIIGSLMVMNTSKGALSG